MDNYLSKGKKEGEIELVDEAEGWSSLLKYIALSHHELIHL